VNTFPPLEGRLADAPFATRQLIVLVPDEDMRQLHAPPDAEEQGLIRGCGGWRMP
jgi:hypothetical protein